MQDVSQWVALASTLSENKNKFFSHIEPIKEAVNTIEDFLEESKKQMDSLLSNENITDLDFKSQISHIRILTKLLFQKRKSMILCCVKKCIDSLKKYEKSKNDKIMKEICVDILSTIENEKGLPKTSEELKKINKLRTITEKLIKNLESTLEEDSQICINVKA
ncbi:unnamed protein product [Blepharisma stoltei]|uniref:Uncharacterized protein n=1 Tax=Blepharisma stoltei TaxID=1481888 RepID=A0AAU9JNI2_9CILI|nr:unnamed protein product [Blepharisma stoltei]